jgi:nucleoside-diphosphate-sugar epimerase
MHKRRFLVTGGTGFLGSALVHRLVRDGYYVRVLDNEFRSSANRLSDIKDNIDLVIGDIRDNELVAKAIQGVDSVIHLAAINGTEFFYSKPELVLDVGVRGILNVLEGCRKCGVGDLIVASSSEVYQTPPIVPSDETVPLIVPNVLNPRYSYGGSKIITELLAFNYGRSGFERVVVFRPHNVYGPDMAWEHVLPQFILRAIDAIAKHPSGPVPFSIQGNGLQTRAFIHINDMIDGIMLLINRGEHLNVYHVGNPEELTIADVATQVVNYFDRDIQIIPTELPMGSTERRCPNIHKLMKLGFLPKISFAEGLPTIIDWYVANAHQRKIVLEVAK